MRNPFAALTCCLLLAGSGALFPTARAQGWPEVFDPLQVETLNFQIDPEIWESIKSDTNFYDPVLNIREEVLMWADGEEPIRVQIRRKSDNALPSEENPQKVSLKIDINEYVVGQEWRGLKKLSLENGNGGNGPVREGLAMNLHRLVAESGLYGEDWGPGYASWVRVVVNGEFIGLYASPEQRDKQFLQNRGLYRDGSVWLYEVNGGTLRDDTVALTDSPTYNHLCYSPFRNSCSQPDLELDLPKWVNMDSMLTMAATEAYSANSDGLFTKDGKNSFGVDFLPTVQYPRWYLPWDLDAALIDSNFNIFSGGPGPQSHRPYQVHILGHPWFRLHYRHIMQDLLDGPLSASPSGPLITFINQLEVALTPGLLEDPNNMMGGTDAASVAGHFASIRNWVTARDANVRTQLGTLMQPPVFSRQGGAITAGEQVSLSHGNADGNIYYTLDGSDPRGLAGIVAGTQYTAPIILLNSSHLKTRLFNGTQWSALREATFTLPGHAADLKITEIMYRPTRDDTAINSELEFIELKNTGTTPIDLSGLRFTNGMNYSLPNGAVLAAGEFLVLGENEAHFNTRYGTKPFQVYRQQLSDGGERVTLKDGLGTTIFSVGYGSALPWPILADGHGFSLVPSGNETVSSPDEAGYWRSSAVAGGSPGADDPEPVGVPVLITEALAHTDLPQRDSIEVYNPNDAAVDLGGWFLSDNLSDPKRWKIPAATVVEPHAYRVFYATAENGSIGPEHFGAAFSLSALGEQVYLSAADGAELLTGYSHGFSFGVSENGVSFGRYITSTGAEHFPPQSALSLGFPNTGPQVGPVVITELMYHPPLGDDEFVELKNVSAGAVKLFDPLNPANTWRIAGIDYNFPTGLELAAGEVLLVVPTTPESFRTKYNIPPAIRIFGPYIGGLSNGGETVRVRKPDAPQLVAGVMTVPYIDIDTVTYDDLAPWPVEPDGSGPSLERISATAYADDPINWRASAMGGSPGIVEAAGNSYETWADNQGLAGDAALPDSDADQDGISNFLEYAFDLDPNSASNSGMPSHEFQTVGEDKYLTITFTRRTDDPALVYRVEFCSTLTPWTGETGVQLGDAAVLKEGLTESVTFRDPLPAASSNLRFGRVVVERP